MQRQHNFSSVECISSIFHLQFFLLPHLDAYSFSAHRPSCAPHRIASQSASNVFILGCRPQFFFQRALCAASSSQLLLQICAFNRIFKPFQGYLFVLPAAIEIAEGHAIMHEHHFFPSITSQMLLAWFFECFFYRASFSLRMLNLDFLTVIR